jgi:hypothetical protein
MSMVKLVVSAVLVLAVFSSSPGFAISKEKCESLLSVQQRQDCDVRKALFELPKDPEAEQPVKRAESLVPDSVDDLKKEDEKINARIKGTICRGC